jgi:trigger factor
LANVTVQDAGPCKKLLKIAVPAKEVADKVDESYGKLRDSVTVAGFRKGHIPRKLLEKRFGEQVIEEVKETAMADACEKALKENGLTALGEPSFDKVEYAAGGDLSFEVTIEVKPQFETPDYKGLKLKRRSGAEVTEEDIAAGMERLRHQRAQYEPAPPDAQAEPNDVVTVDWKAMAGAEEVASEQGVAIPVSGRRLGAMSVDLAACLAGVKAGETREARVVFAHNHPVEKHQGKEGRAHITVKEIKRPRVPELNEALAKEFRFESLDEMKSVVRAQLRSQREREAREDLERQVADQLIERAALEVPTDLVKRQASDTLTRMQLRLRYEGLSDEEVEEKLTELQSASEEAAERQIKTYFIFEKIADAEKVFVTENDVENRIAQLANGSRQTPQQVRSYLEERRAMGQLRIQMREERVMQALLHLAEIQDAD